jgi:catechol 2,3-dioxygenase-like lactoylglutathione lyase family enzyme
LARALRAGGRFLARVTATGLVQFHIAIVTGDMQGAMKRYGQVLGVENWSYWDRMPPGSPMRVAYGSGAGATWELIGIEQDGASQFQNYFREHGEGVQHIGFWCPDMKASVGAALEAGGEIVNTILDRQGNATVQIKPGDLDAIELPRSLFLNAGVGFTLEYFGPGSEQMYRDWFGDQYETMLVPPPPWESVVGRHPHPSPLPRREREPG